MIGRLNRIVVSTFLGLFLIYAGFAILTAHLAIFPWWYQRRAPSGAVLPLCTEYMQRAYVYCIDPKHSLNLDFTPFTVESPGIKGHEEGPILTSGWFVPAATTVQTRGTVVLVHGGGADRRAMLKHVRYLHDNGYHAVLIDAHNHGLSGRDGRGISLGLWESESVIAAAVWAKKNIPGALERPLIAMGTSQGAFAALLAMADSPLIKAVVAENPYISVKRLLREFPALAWEPKFMKEGSLLLLSAWLGRSLADLDVRQFSGKFGGRPVLLIHGDEDEIVSAHQSEEIHDLLAGTSELWVVPHGQHEFLWNVEAARYEWHVLKFLDRVVVANPISELKPLSGK